MKISEVMTSELAQVAHDDTIANAAAKMASADVGSLPVTNGGRLVGVVTDRDIVVRALAKGIAPTEAIATVMTRDPVALDHEDPVSAASDQMAERQIRRIYVTRDDQLAGVVALGDVAKAVPPGDTGEALREISKD